MSGSDEAFDPYHKWLGIAPQQQPPHHYRLLGIDLFEDDADVIAAAADRQMAHVRTYQSGGHADVSQRLLNELAAARVCLLTAEKKQVYDAELRARLLREQDDRRKAQRPDRPPPLPAAARASPGLGVLLKGAGKYAAVELRRFWIWQTRLPGVYWRLGLDIHRQGRYRDRFGRLYTKLEAAQEGESGTPTSGRKTRLWHRVGLGLRKALLGRRRAALLRELGQAAYQAEQDRSGPPDLTEPIRTALSRLAELRAEAAELARIPPGRTLSPRRLAWILLGVAGFFAVLLGWLRWLA